MTMHMPKSIAQAKIDALIQQVARANSALINADVEGYLALIKHTVDFTLMAPFGGAPIHGFDMSREHRTAVASFFKSGSFNQEVIAVYGSSEFVILVTIERIRATLARIPEQHWPLRVTQVFRREASDWQLVHRHADRLGAGISVKQAAALARGATLP